MPSMGRLKAWAWNMGGITSSTSSPWYGPSDCADWRVSARSTRKRFEYGQPFGRPVVPPVKLTHTVAFSSTSSGKAYAAGALASSVS